MNIKLNADRFTGQEYVNTYDKYRPTPPVEIIHQALNYLDKNKADVVLDLGCGTGISTQIWRNFATEIIGVEPSKEMIEVAAKKSADDPHIRYLSGFSNKIPLPSDSLDIIACSQSFHWMEPESTLAEVNRLLKDRGVLLIYDVIWPPSVNLAFEQAYQELFAKVDALTSELGETIAHRWDKRKHLENVRKSRYFNYSKETYFHKTEAFDKDQFIGIALSQGGLEALLKKAFSEKEVGVTEFKRRILEQALSVYNKITYNYRVIYGVKSTKIRI